MTTRELDNWFKNVLNVEKFSVADPSRNGIQMDNNGSEITRVAFAVDACQSTIDEAIKMGAGMLFVHHGLFWSEPMQINGIVYKRVKAMATHNLSLYACHLPLDAHPDLGNNAGIAHRLGLINLEPFGEWHGCTIGIKGEMLQESSLDEILERLFPDGKKPVHVLPFGRKSIRTIGIISGGASDEIEQAIEQNLDVYITGEIDHQKYHVALEHCIHVIAGGHYQTETVGVRLVAERLGRETGMDTVFIDVPTGL